jgi:hypothetical protein
MLTGQDRVNPWRPSSRMVLVTLLIIAFSAGMIAGAVGVRAVEGSFARALRPSPATTMVPFRGVNDTMSEAARAARNEESCLRGGACRDMSDAARAAGLSSWFRGVAQDTMSDAAYRAREGLDR